MRPFFIILLFIFSMNCAAVNKVELFTDSESCSVKEVGFITKINPLIINGVLWEVESHSGCLVKIPKLFFDKSYSRCYLTGIDMTNGGSCSFGLKNDGDKEAYMFEFNVRPSMSCKFTCDEL